MSAGVLPMPAATRPRGLTRYTAVVLAFGIVGYRMIADVGYRELVAIPFGYMGFISRPTISTLLLSWAFLLPLIPLLVRVIRTETLSGHITTLLALISMVPTTTLIAHDPRYPLPYILLIFVYWLIFLLSCIHLPSIQLLRRPLRSEVPHLAALVVFSGTILFLSWRFTGFRLHFGIFDIYDLRAEARQFQTAAIIGYLATFADNVLPVLLAYYLRRRWYLVAAALGVVILFNYGISATKQVIFLLAFSVVSVVLREPPRLNRKILVALGAVIALGVIEAKVFGTLIIGTLSMFRVLAIPAHLHWVHYDFFQTRELLYLTQSALRFFFESPYRDNIQFLIGEYSIGDFTARANNGLFSDGYMNFGGVSVLFYPVAAVVVLKLLEGAAKGLSSSVQFILLMSLSFVFLGLPLPTAVLTGGVGALIVLLSTLPRRDGGSPPVPARPA